MTTRTSKVGLCSVRLSRLAANGTPDYGNASGAVCIDGGISKLEWSWEVEDGQEIFKLDACGNPCVNLTRDPIIKRVNGTLTLCKDADEIHEILGAELITQSAAPIGYGVRPAQGCAPTVRPQVLLEGWRENIACDAPDVDAPLKRLVLARAKFRPAKETAENDSAEPAFDFQAFGNTNIGVGPFKDLIADEDLGGLALFQLDDEAVPECPDPFTYTALPAAP